MAIVTKRAVNGSPRSVILVVHFIVGGVPVLMEQDEVLSVYRVEWAYRARNEAFKDKARLQLHSKSFGLKQL